MSKARKADKNNLIDALTLSMCLDGCASPIRKRVKESGREKKGEKNKKKKKKELVKKK